MNPIEIQCVLLTVSGVIAGITLYAAHRAMGLIGEYIDLLDENHDSVVDAQKAAEAAAAIAEDLRFEPVAKGELPCQKF